MYRGQVRNLPMEDKIRQLLSQNYESAGLRRSARAQRGDEARSARARDVPVKPLENATFCNELEDIASSNDSTGKFSPI